VPTFRKFVQGLQIGGTFAWGADKVVNKISWQKAGRVTEPGRYMLTFGWLTVTAADLAIWKQFPDATFTLVEMPADPEAEIPTSEFHLGAFELPAGPSGIAGTAGTSEI